MAPRGGNYRVGAFAVLLTPHRLLPFTLDIDAWAAQGESYVRVSQVDDVVRALQEVCRGGSALDPKVVESLLARKSAEVASPLRGLTDRELSVLQQMASGRSNAAIARGLYLSERAIEKHISSLFQNLNLPAEGDVNRCVAAVPTFLEATGAA